MKMSEKQAAFLQSILMRLHHDNYYPFQFVEWVQNGERALERWQAGVDLLYRLCMCGLVRILYVKELNDFEHHTYRKNVLEYCRALATIDPCNTDTLYEMHEKYAKYSYAPWSSIEVGETGLTAYLLKKHDLVDYKNDDINIPFIDEVESVFELFEVPISDKSYASIGLTVISSKL